MISFRQFLIEKLEGGAKAGKLELGSTKSGTAREYAEKLFEKNSLDLQDAIPDFEENYRVAQTKSALGWARRKDMPVITSRDVDQFEKKLNSGEVTGEKVRTRKKRIRVSKLNPIQRQIYVDKSLQTIVENGVDKSVKFFTRKTEFIASNDGYILDGHHRFLSALLIDPTMNVTIMEIDLPINSLLPVAVQYSDDIGNKRNR